MRRDLIELIIPNKTDYIGVIRLTTSAIASKFGFNIESIEDVKVAIAEACINALEASENFTIRYLLYDDKMEIFIENVTQAVDGDSREKKLGILIIESLMDEVFFTESGIKMIKNIEDGIDD